MKVFILLFTILSLSNVYAKGSMGADTTPVNIDDDGGLYSSSSALVGCLGVSPDYYRMDLYPTLPNALSAWTYHAFNRPDTDVYHNVRNCCKASGYNTFDNVVTTNGGIQVFTTQTGYWGILLKKAMCSSVGPVSGQ